VAEPFNLKVWIDFVCPYCMLANKPLHEATAGLGVRLEWMPFELRPPPQPQFRGDEEFIQRGWKQSVYPLAAKLGVDMHLPSVTPVPYTRLAFEGLQFARASGKGEEYGDAVLRAFFQRDRDIGDIEVLGSIAAELGLPADEFCEALKTGKFREAHANALRSAYEIGVQAVPSILLGNRLLSGVPDAAALRRAIEQHLLS
jgi:predicted DsbA family dithiol-disulfide isomerase